MDDDIDQLLSSLDVAAAKGVFAIRVIPGLKF